MGLKAVAVGMGIGGGDMLARDTLRDVMKKICQWLFPVRLLAELAEGWKRRVTMQDEGHETNDCQIRCVCVRGRGEEGRERFPSSL